MTGGWEPCRPAKILTVDSVFPFNQRRRGIRHIKPAVIKNFTVSVQLLSHLASSNRGLFLDTSFVVFKCWCLEIHSYKLKTQIDTVVESIKYLKVKVFIFTSEPFHARSLCKC